jgi:hypothetical protein
MQTKSQNETVLLPRSLNAENHSMVYQLHGNRSSRRSDDHGSSR